MTEIKVSNMLHAYSNLIKMLRNGNYKSYHIGRHVGYLEALLQHYGVLETYKAESGDFEIKREIIKSKKWWKKDRLESIQESIIRQTEKYLDSKNIDYKIK